MKNFHVNISVNNLPESVAFYSALFAKEPTVLKPDYAKWLLEDPSVNFAISSHGSQTGIEHLGIEAETEEELQEVYVRLEKAKGTIRQEGNTTCCYAQSNKSWIQDPQGIEWETFYTFGEAATFHGNREEETTCCSSACCAPASA